MRPESENAGQKEGTFLNIIVYLAVRRESKQFEPTQNPTKWKSQRVLSRDRYELEKEPCHGRKRKMELGRSLLRTLATERF